MDALRTALRLPSCRKKFPRDIGKERPCLNFHMGKCDGYCRSLQMKEQHEEAIAQAVSLLEGRFKEVKADLTAEMERAAEELRVERAAELRDRIQAIELLGMRQKVVAGSLADTDVTGFFRGTAKSCFVVLHYMEGELAAKDMDLLETPWRRTRRRSSPPWCGSTMWDEAGCPGRSCCPVSCPTRSPSPGCCPSRWAAGWSWSPPSGGQKWI